MWPAAAPATYVLIVGPLRALGVQFLDTSPVVRVPSSIWAIALATCWFNHIQVPYGGTNWSRYSPYSYEVYRGPKNHFHINRYY